mgnify:CR=1 FL=1
MATESTEEHGKINLLHEIFLRSSVDSVVIKKISHNVRSALSWSAKEFRIPSGSRLDICLPEYTLNRCQ